MWLQECDPWLAYQWGRHLFQREFRERDGVYGDAGKLEGMRLPDGATKIASRSHVNSCAVCHSHPYRDAGAGSTIAKNGGTGRNTPHLFGAGLIEMLGQQLRHDLTAQADANRDGWISINEARGTARPRRARSADRASTSADSMMPMGTAGPISMTSSGRSIAMPEVGGCRPRRACVIPMSRAIGSMCRSSGSAISMPRIARPSPRRFARSREIPSICTSACRRVTRRASMRTRPPASRNHRMPDLPNRCRSRRAIAGAREALGLSRDDPDRDGYCHEITEGEMDVASGCTQSPRPAAARPPENRGPAPLRRRRLRRLPRPGLALAAGSAVLRPGGQMESEDEPARRPARPLAGDTDAGHVPRREPFKVDGLFSDLRYHDMGDSFAQMQYDGTVIRRWRTTPLWGVARPHPMATMAPASHWTMPSSATAAKPGGPATPTRRRAARTRDLRVPRNPNSLPDRSGAVRRQWRRSNL